MWVLKFQLGSSSSIFEPIARKYSLTIIAKPITSFKKKSKYYFIAAATLLGDSKSIKNFLVSVKKDKRIKKIEKKKDFFIVLYEQNQVLKFLHNPEFIQVKPVIIDFRGNECWELACFDKVPLMELVSKLKKEYSHFKLLKLKQEVLDSLTILNVIPNITEKQKKALQLAVENGYYSYPKEVELKKLAKLMGISYSTYQAHLKKAEGKLIPFMSKNL